MDDEWKSRLNIVIPFYRRYNLKHTSDSIWTQKYFYYDDEHNYMICTNNVYSRLENNLVLAKDIVYEFALQRLHKQLYIDKNVEKILLIYIERIAQNIVYGYTEHIYETITKLEHMFGSYKKFVYYEELFYAFDLLKRYYHGEYNCMRERDYHKLIAIMDVYPATMKHMLMELLYYYANMNDHSQMVHLMNTFDYKNSNYVLNKITYLIYCKMYDKNVMYVMEEAKKLIEDLEKVNNFIQLIDLYILLSNISKDIDQKYSERCLQKGLKIMDSHNVPYRIKLAAYLNASYHYIQKEAYGVALDLLLEAMAIKKIMIAKNYTCIIFCYHMLDLSIPEVYLKYNAGNKEGEIDTRVYKFLVNSHKYTCEENVQYLKKHIYKLLEYEDTLYIYILGKELFRLCQPKGKFQHYHDFCKKFM